MKPAYKYLLYITGIFFVIAIFSFYIFYASPAKDPTIKVGILFSKTGTMGESEQPVINATLLAIDEINNSGGIEGKKIVPIIYDGASDWKRCAWLAEKMIVENKVKVIFGCWTSACRKEVKPIVEKYNNLLIYPTQYEGTEESRNIIYLGSTPNQQILPGISWMFKHFGKKVFLVGSDYIYPHVANEILKHETEMMGGEVVGVHYLPLGSTDVDSVIQEIIQKKPDMIFNTINGSTNIAFFERLHELTKTMKRPPVMSFSLSSADMRKIGTEKVVGDYAVWSYFSTQNLPENRKFLKSYQSRYGTSNDINDPAVVSYSGVYLWAQAVRASPSSEPNAVREFMLRQSIASPAGVIYIDPVNASSWEMILIGKVNQRGLFDIVWTSYNPIQPIIYMDFKTKAEWELFEFQLYIKWNESWENNL